MAFIHGPGPGRSRSGGASCSRCTIRPEPFFSGRNPRLQAFLSRCSGSLHCVFPRPHSFPTPGFANGITCLPVFPVGCEFSLGVHQDSNPSLCNCAHKSPRKRPSLQRRASQPPIRTDEVREQYVIRSHVIVLRTRLVGCGLPILCVPSFLFIDENINCIPANH